MLRFEVFLIGISSMQSGTATERHGVTSKRSTKRLKHTGIYVKKEPTETVGIDLPQLS